MGYRALKPRPHEPRRTATDIATPVKLFIHNGALSEFAFPCWYLEVEPPVPAAHHDRDLHDHCGWPEPMRPDHSCQLWIPEPGHHVHGWQECFPFARHYLNFKKIAPIHLRSEYEGYTGVDVHWIDEHEGIEITPYIDEKEDWVVRADVDCLDPKATEFPQHYRFSIFAKSPRRRDLVVLAELIVLPSAYHGIENAMADENLSS